MGASPLAAAHELLDGDEHVDDCAVCGGSLFQPADDDEGPFAMSPPKLSPRKCRCPPATGLRRLSAHACGPVVLCVLLSP